MPHRVESARWPDASAVLQTLAILTAWLATVLAHRDNDGLWFPGDAARHALNGLFWSDFLTTLPSDPRRYVLEYYARYPAIAPVSYPPAFYLLEAVAFAVIAPSAYVAKGLVAAFSLAAALCVAAWLRRYVSGDAGWGGVLMVLQPGSVTWSNVVMLNVPAMALGAVTLYCARRWIEAPTRRRLLLTLGCGAWTALTYFPAGVVVIVSWLWLAGEGRWRVLWRRHRVIVLAALAAPIVLGWLVVGRVPLPFALAYASLANLWHADKWLFYIYTLPRLVHPAILVLAPLGVVAALVAPRLRRDVWLVLAWVIVTYVALSYFWSRDARYALLLVPALLLLAVMGLAAMLEWAATVGAVRARAAFVPILLVLIALHAWSARRQPLRASDGFRDVARFVVGAAPSERVLYVGHDDGIFTFYVRAHDPQFRRAVVRGSKLLYASAILPDRRLQEHVASIDDVMRTLETRCGCAWVLVERSREDEPISAARLLRAAVQGPQFRLVRSFPVRSAAATQVDVYEFLGRFQTPAELSLPFPFLGDGTAFTARPITR